MAHVLHFVPFKSSIDPTFWHALTTLKIDVLKLADEPVPIRGWYERGRWIPDRELNGAEVAIGEEFRVTGKSFAVEEERDRLVGRVAVSGTLKNFNTVEEFKNCDKQALLNTFCDQLWQGLSGRSPSDDAFPRFLAITFADLKKYKYYYWFAFPAFVLKPSWITPTPELPSLPLQDAIEIGSLICGQARVEWLAKKTHNQWQISTLQEWTSFFENVPDEERHLIFIDPAVNPQAVGWPLRNILATVQASVAARKFQVIAYRDHIQPHQRPTVSRSLLFPVQLPEPALKTSERPTAVGWEKNTNGKLGPRLADLGPMMDPSRLAEQAVDLNLKLMRWRILPDLNLEKVASTRCLLLGAGTLGCYVARALMAWGVRKITLVDSAKVSFSNPVRQPLFEFQDCLEGGQPKAVCAASALKRIYPGVDAQGIELSIPMPGHPIPSHLVDQVKGDVLKLEQLFENHDVIYLLMDSRESRWMPTVLAASKRKLVINAALGFDSYLVMRHGIRSAQLVPSSAPASASALLQVRQLGCYFCNDVVAPSDSLSDRTLDQMCTVTRPGLAAIAGATAVEVMAAVLQHPDGPAALAAVPERNGPQLKDESVLGQVPHQIRGSLSKFENMKLVGPAYDKCTGCSETVVKAYETEGFEVLKKVLNEAMYLEKLTGLDKLQAESEAAMESVGWEEEEGEM